MGQPASGVCRTFPFRLPKAHRSPAMISIVTLPSSPTQPHFHFSVESQSSESSGLHLTGQQSVGADWAVRAV